RGEKIGLAIENRFVRAELLRSFRFLRAAYSREDRGLHEFGDLNSGAADSRSTGMDKNGFPWSKFRARDEHVPRGEHVQRNRRGLRKRKRRGLANQIANRDGDLLRASAVAIFAEDPEARAEWIVSAQALHAQSARKAGRHDHFIAALPSVALGDLFDHTGGLGAGNDRQVERVAG